MSPEVQSRIAVLRQKAADGSVTLEEMKEAIVLIRGDRASAAIASETSRRNKSTKKAEIKSADEMLNELGGN